MLFDPAKGITDIEGTILYIAPEVLTHQSVYNERSDMWSIGIVAYSMILGVFPFSLDLDELLLKYQIKKGMYNKQPLSECSVQAISFI